MRPSDNKTTQFEPKIVAFCCNWCSYPAADGAGVARLQYPTNIRIVRVMCGGRVTPAFVLKAFELGADGVLVATCHFEDCHYMFGARKAADVHKITEKLTEMLGIEKERLKLDWISSAEASKFARVAQEFTDTIRKLGPSQIRKKTLDNLKAEKTHD
ncbi:methyl-viologen-reducing hydrogenase subunit delta [candidate division WOR_3 bacterium SM23_42]|uniref:Methyl-viologen-reducing hydrogenase subunit delta n=1 Tax=candidate division WOR_3 bacterium SM23_42 TaxID=1703779 RepID=A0A0S8FTK1_UNCW3|nr:MAG: methyl-viologen-reducing hydrogenase subunit delta [candidate division WOR_3 bacterium SM23_42]